MNYRVWDKINGERDEAKIIEAVDFRAAALAYAEDDGDGWTDGLYQGCAHPIVVEREQDGMTLVYEVEAELVPEFRARKTVEEA